MLIFGSTTLKRDLRTVAIMPELCVPNGAIALLVLSDEFARMALMRSYAGLPVDRSLGISVEPHVERPSVELKYGLIYENVASQFTGMFEEVESELLAPISLQGEEKEKQRRASDYQLSVWGLAGKQRWTLAELSDGQQLRLLLASMLLTKNNVILIDSSLTLLDPTARKRLLAYLRVEAMASKRVIIVFTSSDAHFEMADFDVVLPAQSPNDFTTVAPVAAPVCSVDFGRCSSICIENLRWRAPARELELYGGLSNEITQGNAVMLSGPNGSGKTTLGYLLSGTFPPTSGVIRVDDIPTLDRPKAVVYVPCDPDTVLTHATVQDEIFGSPFGRLRPANVQQVVDILGLGKVLNVNPLDLGWHRRRMVAIAHAVAVAEVAVVIDEPTADIGDADAVTVIRLVEYCKSVGLIIICATNDARLIGASCFSQHLALPSPIFRSVDETNQDARCAMRRERGSHVNWRDCANQWIESTGEFCLFWTRRVYPDLRTTFSKLPMPERATLYDLGCGTGLQTRAVRHLIEAAGCRIEKTVGIDIVPEFVQVANLDLAESETFVCLDITSDTFQHYISGLIDTSTDKIVISLFSLHDMTSVEAMFHRLTSIKRSGSIFVAVMVSPDCISHLESNGDIIWESTPPSQGSRRGAFKVTADGENDLRVPYYHRSVADYVRLVGDAWGPVEVKLLSESRNSRSDSTDYRADDILILTSIAQ